MKNDIVLKINKTGKVGQIIANIGQVLMIIALAGCIIGSAVLAIFPKDFLTITVSGDAVVDINLDKLGIFSGMDLNSLITIDGYDADVTAEWDINGISYGVVDVETTESTIKMLAEANTNTIGFDNLIWVMVPAVCNIIAIFVVLHFTGRLCKTFRYCETPFTDEIVSAIKKLAFSIIPLAFLSSVTEIVTNLMMTGNWDITVNIDLMMVILIVLIFMLAAIFNYGTMLQKESDETL